MDYDLQEQDINVKLTSINLDFIQRFPNGLLEVSLIN